MWRRVPPLQSRALLDPDGFAESAANLQQNAPAIFIAVRYCIGNMANLASLCRIAKTNGSAGGAEPNQVGFGFEALQAVVEGGGAYLAEDAAGQAGEFVLQFVRFQ